LAEISVDWRFDILSMLVSLIAAGQFSDNQRITEAESLPHTATSKTLLNIFASKSIFIQ